MTELKTFDEFYNDEWSEVDEVFHDEYYIEVNENDSKSQIYNELKKMVRIANIQYHELKDNEKVIRNQQQFINEGSNNKMNNEKNSIKDMFGEFGKVTRGELALTLNGQIAVRRNEGEYIRYNAETETMENQMDMVIKEASDLMYIIPTNDIQIGDIIKNKQTYYQILSTNDNGSLKTVNIKNGTKKTILKETNILGFSFYYKVISLFTNDTINTNDNMSTGSFNPMMLMLLDSDNEDDNLLPLLMMSNQTNNNAINPMMLMMMGNKNEESSSVKDLMLMQMMTSGQNNMQGFNPMMLMAMKDGEMDIRTLLMMQMMNNQQVHNTNSIQENNATNN